MTYSITDAITQNTPGTSEGYPVGVPTSYSWYGGGGHTNSSGPPPSNFTAVTGWGQIYPENGFAAYSNPNAYIQVANAKTYVHIKSTDQWVLVQDQATNQLAGAHFVADFSGNAAIAWHETVLPGGSVTVDVPPNGYNDHFWPLARGTYSAGSVDAVYVQMDMRTNDPNLHLVANVGADWWRNATAGYVDGFDNNPGVGMSNWVELSTEWRTLSFYSTTASQFGADPPPVFGPTSPAPPLIPVAPLIISFSPDSGKVGDGITNASIVTLAGAADPDTTITVSDGKYQLGTTNTGSDGKWSYTTGQLSDATHQFTATATDAKGNTSTASSVFNVSVDTVAPSSPAIQSFSPDTSVINGSAESYSVINVSDGGAQLGTAQANSKGNWSLTTPALATGVHTFAATATDAAGNTSDQSGSFAVTVQQALPGTENLVTNGNFEAGNLSGWTLSGNYYSNTYGPELYITNNANDGKYALGAGPVELDGKISQDIQTVAGEHYTLSFWLASENAGPNDFSVKWNGQTLNSIVNSQTQGYKQYTFDVVGADGTSKLEFDFRHDWDQWDLDGVSVTAVASTQTSAPSSSPVAPLIISFSPDSGKVGDGITNASIATLAGAADPDTTITVSDGKYQLGTTNTGSDGKWSYTTGQLSDATHQFTATATDAKGNTSTASSVFNVSVDTVAPSSPAIQSFSPDTSVINGSAESYSVINVSDGGAQLGTAQADSKGNWSLTTPALATGVHTFAATATDAAGNTSDQSGSFAVTVQQALPGTENLVTNGNFEAGNLSGWTLSGNYYSNTYGPELYITNNANDGKYALGAGPVELDGKISQDIQTVAGEHYTLSFWLASENAGPNDFSVKWNGQTLNSIVNSQTQGYKQYTFDVVGADGTSKLEFDFRHDWDQWDLDGVSVTAVASTQTSAPSSSITTSASLPTTDVTLIGHYVAASFATSPTGTTLSDQTEPKPAQMLAPPQN